MSLAKYGLRGCVFDFDGTVVLSEHVHMMAWEDLSKEVGIPLPPRFLEESVGFCDRELVEKLAKAWLYRVPADDIRIGKRKYYLERSSTQCELVPGVEAVLAEVATQVPVALATNSSLREVEPILAHFGLKKYFVSLHTIETVVEPKPHPEIYRNACHAMQFAPDVCLAFEDSHAGAQAARSAGCRLVTLGTLFDPKTLGPAWFTAMDFRDEHLRSVVARSDL